MFEPKPLLVKDILVHAKKLGKDEIETTVMRIVKGRSELKPTPTPQPIELSPEERWIRDESIRQAQSQRMLDSVYNPPPYTPYMIGGHTGPSPMGTPWTDGRNAWGRNAW